MRITFEKTTSLASAFPSLSTCAVHIQQNKPLQTNSRNTKTPLQTPWIRTSQRTLQTIHTCLVRFVLCSTPLTHHPAYPLQYNDRSRLRWSLTRRSWDYPLSRSRVGRDKPNRNEIPEYRGRMDVSLTGNDGANVDNLLRIASPEEIATLERWSSSVFPK